MIQSNDIEIPKLPFNDQKHIPTRAEIDLLLGVLGSMELKRLEEVLETMERHIDWSMHWYNDMQGWSYRASFRERVICLLHFYHGFFIATVSIPLDREEEFLALKNLTDAHKRRFSEFSLSMKMKWIRFPVKKRKDVEALTAILDLKLQDVKSKTVRRSSKRRGI